MDWTAVAAIAALLGSIVALVAVWRTHQDAMTQIRSTHADAVSQIRAVRFDSNMQNLLTDLTNYSMAEYQVTSAIGYAGATARPFPETARDEALQRSLTSLRDRIRLQFDNSDPDFELVRQLFEALGANRDTARWQDLNDALIAAASDAFAKKRRSL